MLKLHEFSAALSQVWDLVSDPDADLVVLEDTLQSLEEIRDKKLESLAYIVKQTEFEADFIRNEEKRLAERRRSLENKADRIKKYMESCLLAEGVKKVKTPTVTVSIQANPPSVEVWDEDMIPAAYRIPQPDKLDKKAMIEVLKNGELVPGANLLKTESLRIR